MSRVKAALSKKKTVFTSKLDLNLRKEIVKCYIWSTILHGTETWTLKSRTQIAGNLLNVILEKAGDQLERSCEK
jgi:hypothetical protein